HVGRAINQLCLGDELAEILVAVSGDREERDDAAVLQRDFGADARLELELVFMRAGIETRCAINPVTIEQRDRSQSGLQARLHQILRQRSAAEKTEGTAGVKIGIYRDV